MNYVSSKSNILLKAINKQTVFRYWIEVSPTSEKMEVKNSRKRFYLVLLLFVGLIAAIGITFSFLTAEQVVSISKSAQLLDTVGLDSPYR